MYKIDRLKRSHLDNCFAANKRNASERAYFKIPARSSMHFRDHSKYSAILKRMTLPEMYRVFREKCVFFIIHCNPSLAARDFECEGGAKKVAKVVVRTPSLFNLT